MAVLRVFDPPMCCSSGLCGPRENPELARFAADLHWLKCQGVRVERFNLAQQPAAFADDLVVEQMLTKVGVECLPLILVDGHVVSQGVYPSKETLAAFVGTPTKRPVGRSYPAILDRAKGRGHGSLAENLGKECCGGSGCCQ